MEPEIVVLKEKQLVGRRVRMSFTANRTAELWRSFMPRRREISGAAGPDLYSVEIYGPGFFEQFKPDREFEKWAALEVTGSAAVPPDMERLTIPGGLYAVFVYRGPAAAAFNFYRQILEGWLPGSAFRLDDRPHLAVMGARYSNDNPDSEEEMWVPVKPKDDGREPDSNGGV